MSDFDWHKIWKSSDRLLTKKASAIATISTEYQDRTGWSSLMRFLMINKIFIQNASAGAAIKRVDSNNEDTSGPKINLPPRKNLCIIQTIITINSSYTKFCSRPTFHKEREGVSNSILQAWKVHHMTVKRIILDDKIWYSIKGNWIKKIFHNKVTYQN